jgi:hypothetical protein
MMLFYLLTYLYLQIMSAFPYSIAAHGQNRVSRLKQIRTPVKFRNLFLVHIYEHKNININS